MLGGVTKHDSCFSTKEYLMGFISWASAFGGVLSVSSVRGPELIHVVLCVLTPAPAACRWTNT